MVKKYKQIVIAETVILCIISFIGLFFLVKHGYWNRFLIKLGLQEVRKEYSTQIDLGDRTNYAVAAWNNCLNQMSYDADIVLFGDSLTYYGNFQQAFPKSKVCNLGYPGDTLLGMLQRIEMIQNVNPKSIFIMGGINGLSKETFEQSCKDYRELVQRVKKICPNGKIYVISVLPVNTEINPELNINNEIIQNFNSELSSIAVKQNCNYINLYDYYLKGGQLNLEYTFDGVHLIEEAYSIWYEKIRAVS